MESNNNTSKSGIEGIYAKITQGLDLLFSNKFDEADALFKQQKDNIPRFALHYAEVMAFRSLISELITDQQESINRLQQAVKLAEDQLKIMEQGQIPKNRNDIVKESLHDHLLDCKIVLADTLIILAAMQVIDDQRVKGLLNLRRGWKTYRQTMSTVETKLHSPQVITSLKFGSGLFYFILSLIPPGLPQKAAALAGFTGGDKGLGLQYLRDAFSTSPIRSYLAGLVLTAHHVFLTSDLDPNESKDLITEAESIIKNSLEKFPEGSIFQAVAGVVALESNQVDVAITATESAIKNIIHVTLFPSVLFRALANCYSMKLDWQATFQILEKTHLGSVEQEKTGKSKNPWNFAWNTLRMGACAVMMGKDDVAKKYFTYSSNAKVKDRWSQSLIIQANRYLANGGQFAMFELMYLTGHYEKILSNTTDARREEILAILEGLAAKANGALTKPPLNNKEDKGFLGLFGKLKDGQNDPKVDNRVSYLTLKCITLRALKRKEEAMGCALEVIMLEKQLGDKLYYVIALLQMGRLVSDDSRDAASKHFETAMKVNNFVWENTLKARIRSVTKQIGVQVQEEQVSTEKDAEKLLSDNEDLSELLKAEEEQLKE